MTSECYRCGRDTDRTTLSGESLCEECSEWRSEHTKTRDANQHGFDSFEDNVE